MASVRLCTIGIALLSIGSPLLAQQPIEVGTAISVPSDVLQEDRRLLVYLPESYHSSTFRYPVLYLLDADSDFLHTIGIVEFLAGIDQIPELIVIGVANTIRSRDLTPESGNVKETEFWPAVGGADRFLKFFRKELIPFVDKTYRTEPYRIIRGQSFGGLFAIHDYMGPAPTFNAYLASSPAVGWNHEILIKQAPDFFEVNVPLPLYVAAAGRDFPENLRSIERLAEVLKNKQPQSELWKFEFFENETHYSLVHRSTYSALKFVYEDWRVSDSVASRAQFEDYEAHYALLSEKHGYTIKIPMHSVIRHGNKLLREKRFIEGIRVLERNIELYPKQPESYWHVGDAYVLSGEPRKARPFFEQALKKALEIGSSDVDHYRSSLQELETTLEK